MSFLARLKASVWGFSGYRRLAADKARGIGFIALVLLIGLAVSATWAALSIRSDIQTFVAHLRQGPDFGMHQGEVYYSGFMPAVLETEDGMVFVIDTTDEPDLALLEELPYGSMMITRNYLIQIKDEHRVSTTYLSGGQWTISKETILRILGFGHWLIPLIFLVVLPFQLAFKLLDAVILALLAQFINRFRKAPTPFPLAWRLGLYAMTLPTLLQWIVPRFSTLTWWGFLLWWGIAIAYLLMGLRAAAVGDETESAA